MINDKSKTVGPNEIKVTKPISLWNKDIKISPKELLIGIGKIVIKGASLDWTGAGESALDTLDAAGLQKEPGEIAWLLIYRSLISAISRLIHNYVDFFKNPPNEKILENTANLFEKVMKGIEVTIDLEFFQNPSKLKLLKDLNAPLINWMTRLGTSEDGASQICSHLPHYFETAVHEKWRAAPQDYVKLKEFYDTPFTKATEESRGWELYYQWLKSQISDRMFAEAFGVEKVYVRLRAYYEEKKEDNDKNSNLNGHKKKKIVFDLENDFKNWLNNFSSDSAVRFISGGPGSGKSTFAKIFACIIANEKNIPTLYIPLHLFDATDNLISAMENYIKGNKFLSGNPLDPKAGKTRLFIIFDGLDELALQGKAASDVANLFIDEVLRRIHEGNSQGLKRQVIITGRTIAIQSVASKLRESKQISYMLPYFLKNQENYEDPEKLLKIDQRKIWWQFYGKATGKNYPSMPNNLNRERLEEITTQPLLNYLVALNYERNSTEFTDDTTLNQIYANLISEVYYRQYEGGRKSVCVGTLKKEQFVRVLEEIALAIWHGDGRTATISSIHEKCISGGVQEYLDLFQEGAKSGVTRLLTAFYFRQSEGGIIGDPTFEFTHKSFGEYLTALRIVTLLKFIQLQRHRRNDNPDDGWSEKESLERWTEFCSVTTMDADIMRFINNEVKKIENKNLLELQGIVCDMLTYTINQGLQFSLSSAQKDFKQLLMLARNAEEALLAVHFGIAKITKQISKLKLKSSIDFGEWISRLRGQRQGLQNKLALNSLGFLDLSGYSLDIQDFYFANLEMANLEMASLQGANLEGANLEGANLEGANLREANLGEANLEEANLGGVNLREANLRRANLEKANLQGANLGEANLGRANLVMANLQGANLRGADLRRASLQEANLGRANLVMANLGRANLVMANLQEVNLQEANLQEANLEGADLRGANLGGANLRRANLVMANLEKANLEGANLGEANLGRANLVMANLVMASLQETNLRGVNLVMANLQGGNLERANLRGANLKGLSLQEANLREANLRETNLQEANLQGANLERANLQGVELKKTFDNFP